MFRLSRAFPLVLLSAACVFLGASGAQAYTVEQCSAANPSSSDWSLRADSGFQTINSCDSGHGLTLSAGGLNESRNFLTGSHLYMTAPEGTSLRSIQANLSQMHDQHGLQGFIGPSQRDDNLLVRFRLGDWWATQAEHDFTPHPYTGGEAYSLQGSAGMAIAELSCGQQFAWCVTKPVIFGGTYAAPYLNIRNMRYELSDTSAPTASLSTQFSERLWYRNSNFSASWQASDTGGGITSTRLLSYPKGKPVQVLAQRSPACATLPGGAYASSQPCSRRLEATARWELQDGTHEIYPEAVDVDGNTARGRSYTLQVDATSPEITLESGSSSSRTLNWSLSDATSGLSTENPGSVHYMRASFSAEGRQGDLTVERLQSTNPSSKRQSFAATLPSDLSSRVEVLLEGEDVAGNNVSVRIVRDFTPSAPPAGTPEPAKPAPPVSSPSPPASPAPPEADQCLVYGDDEEDTLSFSFKAGKGQSVKGSADTNGNLSLTRSSKKLRLTLTNEDGQVALKGKGKKLAAKLPLQDADYVLVAKAGKGKGQTEFTAYALDCQ